MCLTLHYHRSISQWFLTFTQRSSLLSFFLILEILLYNLLYYSSRFDYIIESSNPHSSLFLCRGIQLINFVASLEKEWKCKSLGANQAVVDAMGRIVDPEYVPERYGFRIFHNHYGVAEVQNVLSLQQRLLEQNSSLYLFLHCSLHNLTIEMCVLKGFILILL